MSAQISFETVTNKNRFIYKFCGYFQNLPQVFLWNLNMMGVYLHPQFWKINLPKNCEAKSLMFGGHVAQG